MIGKFNYMKTTEKVKPLNPAQIMVLQVVKEQYDEQELEDLRVLLTDFNHRKMQRHLDETVVDKGYAVSDFKKILSAHYRKEHK